MQTEGDCKDPTTRLMSLMMMGIRKVLSTEAGSERAHSALGGNAVVREQVGLPSNWRVLKVIQIPFFFL